MAHDAIRTARTLGEEIDQLWKGLRVEEALRRQAAIEEEMSRPGFWDRQDEARRLVEELKSVKARTGTIGALRKEAADLAELTGIAAAEADGATLDAVLAELAALDGKVARLRFQAQMSGRDDHRNAFLSVQAGTGGTDASDWAEMLLRMYTRWIERKGFSASTIDVQASEEAGIRYATILVKGPYAYGYLQGEIGVHRLVRISPFDANKRRHTSFAAVDVVPEFDDEIEIEVKEDDLRVDTYRAGGPGGQHVNMTDSAVRLTHLPTGVVAACQNERSQHANRRTAMKMLKAKLYQIEVDKRDAELAKRHGEKGEIAWGNQIRSYTLDPFKLVKDHRTAYETTQVQDILDGDIDPFLESYLAAALSSKAKPPNK